jgi:hypothetical protein
MHHRSLNARQTSPQVDRQHDGREKDAGPSRSLRTVTKLP